jgi:membrane-bound lytic murein transglycosylase D
MRLFRLSSLIPILVLALAAASCDGTSGRSSMGRQASMVAREGQEARSRRYYTLGPKFENQLDQMVGQEVFLLTGRKEDLPLELNQDVLVNLNYFLNDARGFMTRSLGRGQKYIPMMKAILRQKGLPEDLVYLALIESGFRTDAVSTAAAVGPWQFIASTGRRYGLAIDEWVDERMDPVKSTYAAADYLTALHDMFNSWPLAIAAYNSGEGRIQRGMRQAEVENFWDMAKNGDLAAETRRYVPSFLAAAIIAKDPGAYGLEVAPSPPDAWEDVVVPDPIDLDLAAKLSGSTLERLKELNPHLKRLTIPPDQQNFVLRVPQGTTAGFYRAYAALPASQRTRGLIIYTARRGDTVEKVAESHGLTAEVVRGYNSLEGSRLARGQELVLPPSMPPATATAAAPQPVQAARRSAAARPGEARAAAAPRRTTASAASAPVINTISHRVRKGDTISDLARLYGVPAEQIRGDNSLASNDIREGQVLAIRSNIPLTAAATTSSSRRTESWVEVTEGVPVYHTVRRGETISVIAAGYKISQGRLRALNNLSGDSIREGQRLVVGTGPAPEGEGIYVVKSGDTVSTIAERFKIRSDALRALNNLQSDRLQIGQRLVVAAGARAEAGPAPAAAGSTATYDVVGGDTVSTIAQRFGMGSDELRRLNNLQSDRLRIGQSLLVAEPVRPAAPAAPAAPLTPLPSGTATYEIQKGDTVSTIAERFGMTSAALRELNSLDDDRIVAGRRLVVRSGGSRAAAADDAGTAGTAGTVRNASASELYEVRSGDTVSTIAERFGLKTAELRAINNLEGDRIRAGQKLIVTAPGGPAQAASAPAAQASAPQASAAQASPAQPRTASAPAAPAQSAPAAQAGLIPATASYVVQNGDTVGTIAQRFGLRTADFRQLNHLDGDLIRAGQTVLVPAGSDQPAAQASAGPAPRTPAPAAPPASAGSASAPGGLYEVKSGDTVSTIAERFGLRSAELRALNNLSGDSIRIGQKLRVVSGSAPSAAPSASPTSPGSSAASAPGGLYEVKSGDTVSTIAERFGLRSAELRALNNLSGDRIRIGQKLRVSGSAPSAAAGPAARTPAPATSPATSTTSPASAAASAPGGLYEVKSGDTISTIAERFGLRSAELRALNNLSGDNIRVGQKLKVSQ